MRWCRLTLKRVWWVGMEYEGVGRSRKRGEWSWVSKSVEGEVGWVRARYDETV